MRLARIDWSADGTIFLVSMFLIALIIAVLLERASPRRRRSRRLDSRVNDKASSGAGPGRSGDLID